MPQVVTHVRVLPPEQLRHLVTEIQQLLWLDEEGWDSGKELDSDTLGLICEIMTDHGLAPTEAQ